MDSLSDQITLIIIASVFFIIVAIGIVLLILVYQKKQLQYLNEKSLMRMNFDKELFETQLEIQEQTLKNISQEIHDNIGQGLTLAKLNINTMDSNGVNVLQDKINTSKHLITKAIQDLRDLSKSLNTDYVTDLGLVRSVEYELEMIQKSGSYSVDFEVKGEPYTLDKQKELIIFRIVQEVLHNIIRHAHATSIAILFNFEPKRLLLKITDNGNGFNAGQLDSKNYEGFGLGLRNMYNRAKIINAVFKLTSTLEKGTTVSVILELDKEKL
jgi:signal transduction histidine kinase